LSQNKYRTFAREKQTEEEIARLTAQGEAPLADDETNLSPEEKTFKKRYGDLRAHAQRQAEDLQKRIAALESQLTEVTSQQFRAPKSEEEVEAWMSQFPDVGKIVKTIAMKTSAETNKEIEGRLKAVEQKELEAAQRAAYRQFLEFHPDFEEIRETQDWQDWINEQPSYIYDALYKNSTDPVAAKRAVDLYKADRNIKKTKKVDTRESAQSVRSSGPVPSEGATNVKWTESKIAKLSHKEVERYWSEIEEATKHPEFYDISGSAR